MTQAAKNDDRDPAPTPEQRAAQVEILLPPATDWEKTRANIAAAIRAAEADVRQAAQEEMRERLLEWVDSRIEAEVAHRPDENIYKKTLAQTWDQVRRKLSPPPAVPGGPRSEK
jgi:hypothetical protein